MQLRPDQLATHLQKPLAPLYVVHGNEPLLVIEAGDAIRACARTQRYDEREVIVASANFRWDDLFLSAGNLSLFGGSKLVDLRIPSGKPGRDGSEALQRYPGARATAGLECRPAQAPGANSQPRRARIHGQPRRRQPAGRASGNTKAGPALPARGTLARPV